MSKLVINKGWFFAAGNVYGWTKNGFNSLGVGIDLRLLEGDDPLELSVNEIDYTLDKSEARKFVMTYNSMKMTGQTKLGIVSKSLLIRVEEAGGVYKPPPKNPETTKLF